jgi:predicted dehydrogenase
VRIYDKGVTPVPDEASTYGEYRLLMRDGDITSPHIDVGEPLKLQCHHFIECVRQKQQPFTGGREGLEVVQVMEAIDRSIAKRGEPVSVLLESHV